MALKLAVWMDETMVAQWDRKLADMLAVRKVDRWEIWTVALKVASSVEWTVEQLVLKKVEWKAMPWADMLVCNLVVQMGWNLVVHLAAKMVDWKVHRRAVGLDDH